MLLFFPGIVQFFNADDIFRKVLRDMYTSWVEMLLLCFVALGKNPFYLISTQGKKCLSDKRSKRFYV